METKVYHFTDSVDDKVVSSLVLYTVKLPSRRLGVIEEVFTDERYRMQGRATKLVKQAIEKCKELDLDCVELTVREDNIAVQNFYKGLGFKDRFNRAYRLTLGA